MNKKTNITKHHKPPALAQMLLKIVVQDLDHQQMCGDFEEAFQLIAARNGLLKAKIWYWKQISNSIPSLLFDSIIGGLTMLKNYFKIAVRSISKNKLFAGVNIIGLAFGMAVSVLALLWVQNELSYEDFNPNRDDVYRVTVKAGSDNSSVELARSPLSIGPALKADYPEIIDQTRLFKISTSLKYEEKDLTVAGFYFADEDLFNIFKIEEIKGDIKTITKEKKSIIISEKIAAKYFGNEKAVGKILTFGKNTGLIVRGVFKDLPANTDFNFDVISGFEFLHELGFPREMWDNTNNNIYNFVKVEQNTGVDLLKTKIAGLIKKHVPESEKTISLQAFNDIHLHSNHLSGDITGLGDFNYIIIMSAMAFFVLLIACFNFITLTTAKSVDRSVEIGVRKAIGANRKNLVRQFFAESSVIAIIAFLVSLFIVNLVLPLFNNLSGKSLNLNPLENTSILITFFMVALFTGIISSLYPALFISSFNPIKALKGELLRGSKKGKMRNALVTIQFTLALLLIISTLTVFNQINYMKESKLGFDKELLVYSRFNGDLADRIESLKNELKKNPKVLNVSLMSHLLTDVNHLASRIEWEGKKPEERISMNFIGIDHEFIQTFGMQVVEGRDVSKKYETDSEEAYLVNEEAVKQMGLHSPVGKSLTMWDMKGKIVGVVKNFHFQPLRSQIEPMAMKVYNRELRYIYVKIAPGNVTETLDYVKQVYTAFSPDNRGEYNFLDEEIRALYKAEERVGQIFGYFTFLAVLISCLGLFSLSSHVIQKRKKEIGIRKVLGATDKGLIIGLITETARPIFIANIISWPIAAYLMNQWLKNFAYQIETDVTIFIASALLSLLVAVITIGGQAFKAVGDNPVNSLKYE